MRNNIQSADRVLSILTAFRTEGQEYSVTELAANLGVHKSTASRLVTTLTSKGFLERGRASRSLRLGPELGRLGLLALTGRSLMQAAREPMEMLAARTGETVNLAVLDGREVVNIAQVDGPHIVGVGTWTGRRTQPHCVANGKVLLAFLERDWRELIEEPLTAFTPNTITSLNALEAHLKVVRRRGWASNLSELEEGLHAAAVPVFDAFHRCRAALSVSGPVYRMPPDRLPSMARYCRQAARLITARLGGDAREIRARKSLVS